MNQWQQHIAGSPERLRVAIEASCKRIVLDLNAHRCVIANAFDLGHEPPPINLAVAGDPRVVPTEREIKPANLAQCRSVDLDVLGVQVKNLILEFCQRADGIYILKH